MPEAPISDLKIIVIDDDSFTILVILKLLKAMGYHDVVSASDGKAAVKILGHGTFDLVISDLRMPDMDGIQLMRHLAAIDPSPSVIIMSSLRKKILATAERLAKVHQLSVLGTLPKPVQPKDLKQLLSNLESQAGKSKKSGFERLPPSEVRKGIAAGRVIVYVQPKVTIANRVVVGAEALARWQCDDGKILGPGTFVPVAEEHGLMGKLTDAVIDAVFKMMGDWSEVAANLKVSINVSIANLGDVEFADRLVDKAKKAKIPLDRLALEITENKIMENFKEPLDILARLGMQGIDLAIDDFGTGAAGFASLQTLPFTELKIDRAFVHGASLDTEKTTILQSIFTVARQLEIDTVAEGVEEQEDWDLLESLRCDIVQGFIVAKPMPPDVFLEWLIKHCARRGPVATSEAPPAP